jgi:predicted dehydrogenase
VANSGVTILQSGPIGHAGGAVPRKAAGAGLVGTSRPIKDVIPASNARALTFHMPEREPHVRFMTVDPGHFHAALVQKAMYPGVSRLADVFAPLGPDLTDYLNRIAAFNGRSAHPTAWELEIHANADFLERMLAHPPGNVVILSGRNRDKIGYIQRSVDANLNVLADKPWILKSADLPQLEATLAEADRRSLVASDIMTERFEVTSRLQRALVNDPETFGDFVTGSSSEPAVYMESVHYLKKIVAGAMNIRPAWFFDNTQQGEGLNDVGTHLVDLVQWTLFPDQALDYRRDIAMVDAQRWPTVISESDFRAVTNAPGFPDALRTSVSDGRFEYYCNTLVSYTLRGIHIKLNVIWDWEASPGGGDTHYAFYRGTRSRIEIRQTRADGFRPELYVVPNAADPSLLSAVNRKIAALRSEFPSVEVEHRGSEIRVAIPDALRVGHEAHFAEVTKTFLEYLRDRSQLPAWERPNMLAKYFVTTTGTELSRQRPPARAPRIAPA